MWTQAAVFMQFLYYCVSDFKTTAAIANEYSFKGSQVLHRLYKFPKTPLKFYKELTAETIKLVLIYDNWRSKWQVNECKQE